MFVKVYNVTERTFASRGLSRENSTSRPASTDITEENIDNNDSLHNAKSEPCGEEVPNDNKASDIDNARNNEASDIDRRKASNGKRGIRKNSKDDKPRRGFGYAKMFFANLAKGGCNNGNDSKPRKG